MTEDTYLLKNFVSPFDGLQEHALLTIWCSMVDGGYTRNPNKVEPKRYWDQYDKYVSLLRKTKYQ